VRFDDPEVRECLARSMILRLAALSPKGRPNIRCLWFVCQQGRIYIFTANISPIGRSISVHPDVALLFDGERGPRSSRLLRVRGHAVFRRESGIVARVMLGLARKYFLTRPGLRNLLAHARTVPLAVRFYAEGWRSERGKGLTMIMEVLPESFEFLPGSPAQAAS
jgi:pyridoxine/pyridoxamine 5'-phosphate oxidase